ncbi:hypothetical protein LCGC14_2333980, partial [marine sediment metagenome]
GMQSDRRCHRQMPAGAAVALALCALVLAFPLAAGRGGVGTARAAEPAGGKQAPPLDHLGYARIAALRRSLQLDRRYLAAMGCDRARGEAVLLAVLRWYRSNADRLRAAELAANQAEFALDQARRQARAAKSAQGAKAQALLPAAHAGQAAAASRVGAVKQTLISAVEAKLTSAQRQSWRGMRAAVKVGGRGDWLYAPELTAEQAKTLRDAETSRRRALRADRASAKRAAVEASFRGQVAKILSKSQRAAVAAAQGRAVSRGRDIWMAERKVLPAPPRKRPVAPAKVVTSQPVRSGLASRYPQDKGLGGDPDTVLFCDFDTADWPRQWGLAKPPRNVETVDADKERKFEPFAGKALKVTVHKGTHYGTSLQFPFRKMLGAEPEEIYFRYYLRLADTWRPVRGGKLPGIGGTYGRGGWGGRRSTGINGWSARGLFRRRTDGKTPIGFYCYNADQRTTFGDCWIWARDGLGFVENNRWYCIEQYARMNTPGANDGTLRAWVDGRLAFEKTDVRMRDVKDMKIDSVWINVYFGGTWSAKYQNHLFIDNVAIARKYIGPMAR